MRNSHGRIWNMDENSEKRKKLEILIVGPGLWREN